MKIKYYIHTSKKPLGFFIQKIKIIKEKNPNYILGQPETLLKWGEIKISAQENFFRKSLLFQSLEEAVEQLYYQLDNILINLKNHKKSYIENIKIIENMLAEEKRLAKTASRDYKIYVNQIKNLNIPKLLENKGIVDENEISNNFD